MTRRILIIGAGGHGQVVADILLAAYRRGADSAPGGFLDDDSTLWGVSILGLPVCGPLDRLSEVQHDAVIVAIGENESRRRVLLALSGRGTCIANAIHPSAVVAADVQLGQGVAVCAGAVVNTGSVIGDGVILNTGCTVDHHSRIGDYAHIAPGVHLAGSVAVGQGALIGVGTSVIPGRSIGEWTIVGAGSVITRDIPPRCMAAGVPARVVACAHNQGATH